jgi:hypothetical protein
MIHTTLNIVLASILILYSNLAIYKALQITGQVKNLKEYFEYDEGSVKYINAVMVSISIVIIILNQSIC